MWYFGLIGLSLDHYVLTFDFGAMMKKKWFLFQVFLLALLMSVVGGAEAAEGWKEPQTAMEFIKVAGGCYVMGQGATEAESLARLR